MQASLDLVIIIQIITAIVVVAGFVWRLPSKADIRRLDDRIDDLDTKIDDRYDKLDTKIDDTRKEMKVDMQRLEDKLGAANQYHARSVELLDANRKELEERRQPL